MSDGTAVGMACQLSFSRVKQSILILPKYGLQ